MSSANAHLPMSKPAVCVTFPSKVDTHNCRTPRDGHIVCDVKGIDTSSFKFNTSPCAKDEDCYVHMQSDTGQPFFCAKPSNTAYQAVAQQPIRQNLYLDANVYIDDLNKHLQNSIDVTPMAGLDGDANVCMPIYYLPQLNVKFDKYKMKGSPMFLSRNTLSGN